MQNNQNNVISSNNAIVSTTIASGSITTGPLMVPNTSSVNWVPQKTYWRGICLDDELPELINTKKQFNALKNLLIQKGILTEQEIDDAINAMELMDEMTKDCEK